MTSICEKASLIRVRVTGWGISKNDPEATSALAEKFDTSEEYVGARKWLVKKGTLKPINKIKGQARNYLRGNSPSPVAGNGWLTPGLFLWDKEGFYCLPNEINLEVMQALGEFKSRFEDQVRLLRNGGLEQAIQEAWKESPRLLSNSDYLRDNNYCGAGVDPEVINTVCDKFSFEIVTDAIHDDRHVFTEASKEYVAKLKRDARETAEQGARNTMISAVKGVCQVVQHLADSLRKHGDADLKAGAFRDSTGAAVADSIRIGRAMNLDEDPEIALCLDEAETILDGVGSANDLRGEAHADVRREVVGRAEVVARNMANLFE